MDLAYRSGEITDISAHEVHENDTFEYELGLEPKLKHVPALKDRGPVILYYAVFHTKAGGYGFEVMSVDDIRSHMNKFSKAAQSGFSPWKTNFDEMAKKTVIKRVLKYAPIKTEFVRQVAQDETIKTNLAENMADLPDETITIDGERRAGQRRPRDRRNQRAAGRRPPLTVNMKHGGREPPVVFWR